MTLSKKVLKLTEKQLNINVDVTPDVAGRDYVTTKVIINGIRYISKHVALSTAYKWKKWSEVGAFKNLLKEFKRNFDSCRFERQQPYRSGKKKQMALF